MRTFITFLTALFVTVGTLAQTPDAYETNNDVLSATALTLNFTNHSPEQSGTVLTFTNDSATVKTAGADIHVAGDVDYYKVVLPANANSMFKAELFNRYNNPNIDGSNYSVYGRFAYSLDGGQTWSNYTNYSFNWTALATDTVYFRVEGASTSQTGTYALQIDAVADFNEPNKTPETAMLLPLFAENDTAVVKTVNSLVLGATDYYKVALPPNAGCMFKAELFNRYNNPNIDGSNYSVYGRFAYSLDGGQTWSNYSNYSFNWTALATDTVYFRVEGASTSQMGTYALQIDAVADFNEPNNTPETATVLPFAFAANDSAYVKTAGTLVHIAGDVDYYRVNLPARDANHTVFFTAKLKNGYFEPEGIYSLYGKFAYSIDGGATWSSETNNQFATPIALPHQCNAILFKVLGNSNSYTGSYALEVKADRQLIPADGYEPNDNVATATVLPVVFNGNTASIKLDTASIHVNSNYDYYRMDLPAFDNRMLQLKMTRYYSSFDIGFMYSFDGGATWSSRAYNSMSNFVDIPYGCHTVYVQVQPWNTSATYTGKYGLQIDMQYSTEYAFWWRVGADTLYINGSGAIPDYSENTAPWAGVRNNIKHVVIAQGITEIGNYSFGNFQQMEDIALPEGITRIGNSAFGRCAALKNINLPAGLLTIGRSAFDYTGLQSVTVPNSVTDIDSYAFQYCASLVSVVLPTGLETIKSNIFSNCPLLSGITLPTALKVIESSAFRGTKALTGIALPASLQSIGSNAFQGSGLTSVQIPANVRTMGVYIFAECPALTTFSADNGITNLGGYAFYNDTLLVSVTLPASLTLIDYNAFDGCKNLTSLVIPQRVTNIGSGAFHYSGITTIVLPGGLTQIQYQAFDGCKNLTDILIPSSVNALGNNTFRDCSSLATVRFSRASAPSSLGSGIFAGALALDTIWVPQGALGSYVGAFTGDRLPDRTPATVIAEMGASQQIPNIANAQPTVATYHTQYAYPLYATGLDPIVWELTAGALPQGLSLDSTGLVSGYPSEVGNFDFTVRAKNDSGEDSQQFRIGVQQKNIGGGAFTFLKEFAYTGLPVIPTYDDFIYVLGNDTLKPETEFVINPQNVYNNINKGNTAHLYIYGTGNFKSSTYGYFTIGKTAYSYSIPAAIQVQQGNGLDDIAEDVPLTATGVMNQAVTGATSWYSNPERTTPAIDSDLSTLALGEQKTLYWTFAPDSIKNPNYTGQSTIGTTVFTAANLPPLVYTQTDTLDLGKRVVFISDTTLANAGGRYLTQPLELEMTGADASFFSFTKPADWKERKGGAVKIAFRPEEVRDYDADLILTSGAAQYTVHLKGRGMMPTSYEVTANVQQTVYAAEDNIEITGVATYNNGMPAANIRVDLTVTVMNYNRSWQLTTDSEGKYTQIFTAQPGEAGHYTVKAFKPGLTNTPVKAQFDIPDFKMTSSNVRWEVFKDIPVAGNIQFQNRSNVPLTDIAFEVVEGLPNAQVTLSPIATLAGSGYAMMNYAVTGTEETTTERWEAIKIRGTSAEGISNDFTVWFYCKPTQGDFEVIPRNLTTQMNKGKSKLVELTLVNVGNGPTGTIEVGIPELDWMKLANADTLPSIEPGDTTKISLWLTPQETTQLNTPFTGNLAVNCANGKSVGIPYNIQAISDSTGVLVVDVVDEYFYNTEEKTHVKDAHVMVKHPFSSVTIAEGYTDANGLFTVDKIPEGYWTLMVEAPNHESYRNNVLIEAGATNNKQIFISFNAVSYTWQVVPTEIEDEYEIELVAEYQANVPKPVVQVNMPKEMPYLVGEEEYQFNMVLTNLGLITAEDVDIAFPEDDEYEFVYLNDGFDLPAHQSLIVPVTMRRRDANPQEVRLRAGLMDCFEAVTTRCYFYCGPTMNLFKTINGYRFNGRTDCFGEGGGGGGGGSGLGWGPWGPVDPGDIKIGPGGDPPPVIIPISQPKYCNPDLPTYELFNYYWTKYQNWSFERRASKHSNSVIIYAKPTNYSNKKSKMVEGGNGVDFMRSSQMLKSAPENWTLDMDLLTEKMGKMETHLAASNRILLEIFGNQEIIDNENYVDFIDALTPYLDDDALPIPDNDFNIVSSGMPDSLYLPFIERWNQTKAANADNVFVPNETYPNIMNSDTLLQYSDSIDMVNNYIISKGYADIDEMAADVAQDLAYWKEEIESQPNGGVCASVTMEIKQRMTMTREAFRGTLTIHNGHGSLPMENVSLELEVRDDAGELRNDLFQINTESLIGALTGIDGSGSLTASSDGSVNILFIPEIGAAPEEMKIYSFGGVLAYDDPFSGTRVTVNLFPVALEVHPSPNLDLHYFMQRDILGDDALTTPIEPMIPADLAVIIHNKGYGPAKNVQIESAQPEIIENEKGLLINFNIIGSSLGDREKQLGMTNVNFGDIQPQTATVGHWWLTSSLLGHFVSYKANITHLNSYGNPDLSLVDTVTIHELTHSVRAYGAQDDGILDFLVNDNADLRDYPDGLYYSDASYVPVHLADTAYTGKLANLQVTLSVQPSETGWNYARMDDPTRGKYKLTQVTRSDNVQIPLENVWQTFVTLNDDHSPLYENKIHIADDLPTTDLYTYNLVFSEIGTNTLTVDSIVGLPAPQEGQTVPLIDHQLSGLTVYFDRPILGSSFTVEDLELHNQGGLNMIDNSVSIDSIKPDAYRVNLGSKTVAQGYYNLIVHTLDITDMNLNSGYAGMQVEWIQYGEEPVGHSLNIELKTGWNLISFNVE
ncbi:MAG: leucine-rich repeat protein, partial [Tannerella sp.]|nr:leucine-rich repeat protein [Tannerella sp.]